MLAPIALELRCRGRRRGQEGEAGIGRTHESRVDLITEYPEGTRKQEREQGPKKAGLPGVWRRGYGGAARWRSLRYAGTGAKDANGPLPSISCTFNLERHEFTDARSIAIAREGGDVHEEVFVPLRGADETEAAFFIPPDQVSVAAHARAIRWWSDEVEDDVIRAT